jgi:hypothetical protein
VRRLGASLKKWLHVQGAIGRLAHATLADARVSLIACVALCASAGAQVGPAQGVWTHVGGTSARNAVSAAIVPDVGAARWTRSVDEAGLSIAWRWQSTPIVSGEFVFALGTVRPAGVDVLKCFAVRRSDGAIAWSAVLPNGGATLSSQSSACVSISRGEVYVATGAFVTALRASDGAVRWQTPLARVVVNASPMVTEDLRGRNRVFVTDYDFDASGAPGSVYCINVDAFDAAVNPYLPGQIVWMYSLGGTSGNSVAYVSRREGGAGLVYVASAGEPDLTPGTVLALPAGATSVPMAVWSVANSIAQGFFGGVSVARVVGAGGSGQLSVFASSYAFYDVGNTLRIDARTGVVLGDVASNRSSTAVMALPPGLTSGSGGASGSRVLLSAGYDGFGSVPSLVAMRADSSSGVVMAWDSWGSGGQRMGGWNHQPAVSIAGGRAVGVVGTIASGAATLAAQRLEVVDLSRVPGESGFVMQTAGGIGGVGGGGVALAGLNVYSIGASGLAAFGPAWTGADVNGSARLGIDDLYAWDADAGTRDVEGDGDVDDGDRATLRAWMRWRERGELMALRVGAEVAP